MWNKRVGLLLIAMALSSCAGWPVPPSPMPAAQTVAPVPDMALLFVEHERLLALPAGEQAQEIARLNATSQSGESTEVARESVQMALLLAHKGSPAELARALALVDRLSDSDLPANRPWQPLVRTLASLWSEQKKLVERAERQAQQLRDNQRKLEQLNETVAALKAIELSLPAKPAKAPGAEVTTPPGNGGGNP